MRDEIRRLEHVLCPYLWNHFSTNLDGSMRVCCNTYHGGLVLKKEGMPYFIDEITHADDYINCGFLKETRQTMMQGEAPRVCQKCFDVERYGGRSVRQAALEMYQKEASFQMAFESTDSDGVIHLPRIVSLDFSQGNHCNLACIMCNPGASHKMVPVFDKLGLPYDHAFHRNAETRWHWNESFRSLVDSLIDHVEVVLTTGGEPFIGPFHVAMVEQMVSSGHAHRIQLRYHTNAMVYPERLAELWPHFRCVNVNVSLEGTGTLNDYIRFGSRWETILNHMQRLKIIPNLELEVHTCVLNVNVFQLPDLYEWSERMLGIDGYLPIHIHIEHPEWLTLENLPPDLRREARSVFSAWIQRRPDLASHPQCRQIFSYLDRMDAAPFIPERWNAFLTIQRRLDIERGLSLGSIVPAFRLSMSS